MINDRLDRIGDYPFDRLRALLDSHSPANTKPAVSLALGEPQHPPPAIVQKVINETADQWGKYPPVWGTPLFRKAIKSWLERRYGLEDDMLNPDTNIIPVSGTREALFKIALTCVPEQIKHKQPVVIMPYLFYKFFLCAAALAGANPIFAPATADSNF